MIVIRWFQEIFNDIGLTLSFLSLVATVVVSFMVYWLQHRHEIEVEKLAERQRQKDLENKANEFLIDNEAERDYLPWCAIASNLHRFEHHARSIYTNFCRLTDEQQKAVLKLAGYSFEPLPETDWVSSCMELLKKDVEKYKLGRDILYDRGKFFRFGFDRYRDHTWIYTESDITFNPIYKGVWYARRSAINCNSYIDEFFRFQNKEKCVEDILTFEINPHPPIDYVWEKYNLSSCEESIVCAWVMTLVEDISLKVPIDEEEADKNKKRKRKAATKVKKYELDFTDAKIDFYEDQYYEALQALYNTYYARVNNELH